MPASRSSWPRRPSRETEIRGAFSVALLDTLAAIGPATTYRSLLAGVRARVERVVDAQSPVLDPVDADGPADAIVLDGTIERPEAAFHVTTVAGGFEVDAGSIHGLRSARHGEAFELACLVPGSPEVAGLVRVTEVGPARSAVEPLGWQPADLAYDAVIAAVPLPAARIRSMPGARPEATTPCAGRSPRQGRTTRRRPTSGSPTTPRPDPTRHRPTARTMPSSCASPPCPTGTRSTRWTVREWSVAIRAPVPRSGSCGPTAARSWPTCAGIDPPAARALVAQLEHIARWEQLKALGGHPSKLRDAVRLEIQALGPDQAPGEAASPLRPAAEYRLAYARRGDAWSPPAMLLRLVNTSDRDLFVAVLDLTDRFRCHASLFPTARISARHAVAIWDGRPVPAGLPADRPVVSGAEARDWLKVIVSETDFDASAFEMTALDEPFHSTRSAAGSASTLERLANRVLTRDIGAGPDPATHDPDWCAETYAIRIVVP